MLPIRPDGSRPAWHVIGANGTYGVVDTPWDALAGATHLHIGGLEFFGGSIARTLEFAREHGVTTSADLLAPGDGWLDWIAPALPHLDHLLPNAEQVLAMTGADDVVAACTQLVGMGVRCVAATTGADGAVVVDPDGSCVVPAFPVDVVDTTGCGDAFSAGYIRGLTLGLAPRDAAVLGCATAAQVVGGLGSDHGVFDLATVRALAGTA